MEGPKQPTSEQASNDLKNYQQQFDEWAIKLNNCAEEADKLKVERDMLKVTTRNQNKLTTFYENMHIQLDEKIQNVLITQNKGNLVTDGILEQIKNVKEQCSKNKITISEYKLKLQNATKIEDHKNELLERKKQIEESIGRNNQAMKSLLEILQKNGTPCDD